MPHKVSPIRTLTNVYRYYSWTGHKPSWCKRSKLQTPKPAARATGSLGPLCPLCPLLPIEPIMCPLCPLCAHYPIMPIVPVMPIIAQYCPLSAMPIAQDKKTKTKTNYDAVGGGLYPGIGETGVACCLLLVGQGVACGMCGALWGWGGGGIDNVHVHLGARERVLLGRRTISHQVYQLLLCHIWHMATQ
jgi:hypothetical protein